MPEIQHTITIKSSPAKVFKALTEERHIAQWWTSECSVKPVEGSQAIFQWRSQRWMVVVIVSKLVQDKEVVWFCEASNIQNTDAWVGTELRFVLTPEGKKSTNLQFSQTGYRESPCFAASRDGWEHALKERLKSYVEMGIGRSFSYHG